MAPLWWTSGYEDDGWHPGVSVRYLFSGRMLIFHCLSPCLSCDTRYTARPCKKSVIHIQPPFLRPEIDRQMPAKVRDNGIQSHNLQNRVCASTSHAKVKPLTVKYFPAYHLRIVTSFVKGSDLSCFTVFFSFFFSCQRTSAGAVELSDIKQGKTPPPLPPKPDHGLLKSHASALDGTVDIYTFITWYSNKLIKS